MSTAEDIIKQTFEYYDFIQNNYKNICEYYYKEFCKDANEDTHQDKLDCEVGLLDDQALAISIIDTLLRQRKTVRLNRKQIASRAYDLKCNTPFPKNQLQKNFLVNLTLCLSKEKKDKEELIPIKPEYWDAFEMFFEDIEASLNPFPLLHSHIFLNQQKIKTIRKQANIVCNNFLIMFSGLESDHKKAEKYTYINYNHFDDQVGLDLYEIDCDIDPEISNYDFIEL